jgi:phosphatidylglycerophosphatase A
MRFLIYLIGTFFYSGKIPIAPGTAGSFVALIPLVVCAHFFSPPIFSIILSAGIIVLITMGIPVASYIEEQEQKKDPRIVVIDEAAGQWITFLFIPGNLLFSHVWILPAGFLLFRFFDIVKLFPARHAEKVARGVGIVLDDVIAGLYACIGLNLLVKFLVLK